MSKVSSGSETAQMNTAQTPEAMTPQAKARSPAPRWPLVQYFLRLGTLGFGGPVALIGYMHWDLVESRGRVTEADY